MLIILLSQYMINIILRGLTSFKCEREETQPGNMVPIHEEI